MHIVVKLISIVILTTMIVRIMTIIKHLLYNHNNDIEITNPSFKRAKTFMGNDDFLREVESTPYKIKTKITKNETIQNKKSMTAKGKMSNKEEKEDKWDKKIKLKLVGKHKYELILPKAEPPSFSTDVPESMTIENFCVMKQNTGWQCKLNKATIINDNGEIIKDVPIIIGSKHVGISTFEQVSLNPYVISSYPMESIIINKICRTNDPYILIHERNNPDISAIRCRLVREIKSDSKIVKGNAIICFMIYEITKEIERLSGCPVVMGQELYIIESVTVWTRSDIIFVMAARVMKSSIEVKIKHE